MQPVALMATVLGTNPAVFFTHCSAQKTTGLEYYSVLVVMLVIIPLTPYFLFPQTRGSVDTMPILGR